MQTEKKSPFSKISGFVWTGLKDIAGQTCMAQEISEVRNSKFRQVHNLPSFFSFYFHADGCYDASNIITCEDELEKGNCGDIEVAHACSKTCETLSCTGNTHEIVHQVTSYVSSLLIWGAVPFTEKFFSLTFRPQFELNTATK